MSDFRGKVVVINVRATWCPPCRRELPVLKARERPNRGMKLTELGSSLLVLGGHMPEGEKEA